MRIGIIGTGYVGLVTGAMFADRGNDVICIDNNPKIIKKLLSGHVPFFEPGLEEVIKRNISKGTLKFSQDKKVLVKEADIYFFCVGTPSNGDGSFDLSFLLQATKEVSSEVLNDGKFKLFVCKSTVPQGTHKILYDIIKNNIKKNVKWDYVSNPETLAEGRAIKDFSSPDRVIIGTTSEEAFSIMEELYHPFIIKNPDERIIKTSPVNAELIKLGANTALAMKVAYINEMARIADITQGADIVHVREGIIQDQRIGKEFLFPGPGYGGSCFPKDVQGLTAQSKIDGFNPLLLNSIHESNEAHKKYVSEKIESLLNGGVVAIWGVTFKAGTDDMRNSPAISIITALINRGVKVKIFDPKDIKARDIFGHNVTFCSDQYDAVKGADMLIHITDWSDFHSPNYDKLKSSMKGNVLIDLRNRWLPETANKHGFDYVGVGRTYIFKK